MRESRTNFRLLTNSVPPQESPPGLLYSGNFDPPTVPRIGDIVQFQMFNELLIANIDALRYGTINNLPRTLWIAKVTITEPERHNGRRFEVPLSLLYFLR